MPVFRRARIFVAGILIAAVTIGATSLVHAQEWPNRPIRILVGFGPGGGTDIVARIVADALSQELKQQVIVENRPSGGGILAANSIAKGPKDGNTALMTSNAHVISRVMYKSLPYDPVGEFQGVSMVGIAGLILVVRKDFPANNFEELVKVLRANPGKYNYGTSGTGTTQHFAVELMSQMADVTLQHIPYRGGPAAIAALLSKQVDIVMELVHSVRGHIESGELKAIAVTAPERFPAVPDVPTFAESGLPGYAVTSWYGVLLAAGTPPAIVEKFNAAMQKVLQNEKVREQIVKVGALPKSSTPDDLRKLIQSEIQRWEFVREKAGIPQR